MSINNFSVIQCVDLKMKELLRLAENVASSRATVLIQGESGTGKELIARYIHAKSNRSSKLFYAINCAAVPEGLLESELFGYEKGAFTGASARKIGKFELASESTFLLDEISEMPILLQAKLLRVIQEGEVERIGANRPVKVNVRIIATTNKNLRQLVECGQFREDLFYRLNVIPIDVPALRERPADISMLSQFFLDLSCEENNLIKKEFTESARKKILSWDWPGNVRELRNIIERSVLLSPSALIDENNIMLPKHTRSKSSGMHLLNPGMTVAEAERALIIKTLEFTKQNRTKAAGLLGISIRTLRNKITEYRKQEVIL